ncbi:AAA family ATPase [Candidatus Uhrbacteria bacterium]|nr:AAA family ATPase [Candidatus Uhrbacteria bacterium]
MKSIIVRGPLGVGKSTVAKMVAEKIGGVYISVDEVLDQNGLDKAVDGEGIPLANFLKANEIIMLGAKQANDEGKPVVVDGNFYHKEQIDHLVRLLGKDVMAFTLKASVETCIARDAARAKPYGEDATRAVHMFVSAFDYGTVIDTEQQNVEESVKSVMDTLDSRLLAFFNRFPLLEKTLTVLNKANVPFAIGGSGCLFLLGNERLPDDVDIYLPNDRHNEADQLFGITSFPYQSEQEEVRNSNVEGDHSIQLTSALILKIQGKHYDLALTPDVLSKRLEMECAGQKVFLYPPEDVLLIKALLQRGQDVGKHDIEDIQNFVKIYPDLRMDYLQSRINQLEATERVGVIFKH